MNSFFDVLSIFFALAGGLIFITGGIGLLRMPDVYSRTSTIATATGLGLALLTLAVLFHDFTWINCVKAIIAIHVQLATSAVGGIAIDRSAYLSDVPLSTTTQYDELARDNAEKK
jgi:multicomponent Na+:H+ antiporter subunit G